MIEVVKIKCDLANENCYFVIKNNKAIIIDPGSNFEEISLLIKNRKLDIEAILLTHGHFDHIMSCKKLQDLGYKVYISVDDSIMCSNNELNFAKTSSCDIEIFSPDYLIQNNENELNFPSFMVKVLHVPGHSLGGLAYIINNNLFSGDTLFDHGYGRTDLYGGNFRDILKSIKILRAYTKNGYELYPGHDY